MRGTTEGYVTNSLPNCYDLNQQLKNRIKIQKSGRWNTEDTLSNFHLFTKTSFPLPFHAKYVQIRFSDHSNSLASDMFPQTSRLVTAADFAVVITWFKINLNIKFANFIFSSFCLNILGGCVALPCCVPAKLKIRAAVFFLKSAQCLLKVRSPRPTDIFFSAIAEQVFQKYFTNYTLA